LEREAELEATSEALAAARSGDGAALLFHGPPGIGKTELLRAATARARRAGLVALSARGGELEQSFPFGLVQQLFEPALADLNTDARDELLSGAARHAAAVVDPRAGAETAELGDPAVAFHGLYWFTANLAAQQPLLLVVDDLHWSDRASLEWLVYLCRRIEGMAVAVVLAARPSEPGAPPGLLEPLRREQIARRVEPSPLSASAAEAMARQTLGPAVQAPFAEACRAVTGGNPFYLTELLRTLHSDGVAGGEDDVEAVERVTPRAVLNATVARLARTRAATHAVAEAVALLEPLAALHHVSELAGVDPDVTAAAADELLAIGLLDSVDPCRFAHPVLRAAVEEGIPPAGRQAAHGEAARLLEAAGVPIGAAAAHLLRTAPAGDAGRIATLRRAAAEAGARGASAEAVDYLCRALSEGASAPESGALLLELGIAEGTLGRPEAIEHLREALALAATPDELAVAAHAFAQTLAFSGDVAQAYEVAGDAAGRLAGREDHLTLRLEAKWLTFAAMLGRNAETAELARTLEARLEPDSPTACTVFANVAFREMISGGPRARVERLAERGLFRGELAFTPTDYLGAETAAMALLWVDVLDRVEALLSAAIGEAQRMGSLAAFIHFSGERGYMLQRRGELTRAELDIEPVFARSGEGLPFPALIALIPKTLILVHRGQPAAAEGLAAGAPVPPEFEDQPLVALLRHAQGAAQLAQRRFDDAARTLTRAGEVLVRTGSLSPTIAPWRSDLALALAGAEQRDEALTHAREELELGERCDVDRVRGAALRALGLLQGGEGGIELLGRAVAAYERSPARLERAQARCDLGAALRRAGRRGDARPLLTEAFEEARRCGASALAERTAEELGAAGARPRRLVFSGVDSLTPSERRVAEMAADGLSNPEIAQALFVTRKTVEKHLGSAYRKLDVSSRDELPAAMRETGTGQESTAAQAK
jgi:DNA-binding CsgD family transcriptional regulator